MSQKSSYFFQNIAGDFFAGGKFLATKKRILRGLQEEKISAKSSERPDFAPRDGPPSHKV